MLPGIKCARSEYSASACLITTKFPRKSLERQSTQPVPPQPFSYRNKTYTLDFRFTRYYEPFRMQLLKFSHDKYRGTEKPKNFSSRIRLQNPVNGEDREFSSISTVSALLEQLGMKPDRVAVELNRELLPRDRWVATQLQDGDRLEIVHFVGGGLAQVTA